MSSKPEDGKTITNINANNKNVTKNDLSTSISKKRKKKKTSSKKPIPLAPPPTMQSRKKARIVTTLFHKHTRNRDLALQNNDIEAARESEDMIEAMGGREEYQRASVCSTKHHSTSKWVLKVLGRMDWLNGFVINSQENGTDSKDKTIKKKKNAQRRNVQLLEVGAINCDLVDAASRQRTIMRKKKKDDETTKNESTDQAQQQQAETDLEIKKMPLYRLSVRAIDLRSMSEKIEEVDFLKLPFVNKNVNLRYDAIVCSMVINCVTTPEDRGKMLSLLFHHLRPGGLCFLTLPKLCLYQSQFITKDIFENMLTKSIGFETVETRESPKVAFFVLKRPDSTLKNEDELSLQKENIQKWAKVKIMKRGKKYRNTFSVVLNKDDILKCGEDE